MLQKELQASCADKDVLTFFPYQGTPFDEYEKKARDEKHAEKKFPHGVKRIDLSKSSGLSESIIDTLTAYQEFSFKLRGYAREAKKITPSSKQAAEQYPVILALVSLAPKLSGLNTLDIYLGLAHALLAQASIALGDKDLVKSHDETARKLYKAAPKNELKVLCKYFILSVRASFRDPVTQKFFSHKKKSEKPVNQGALARDFSSVRLEKAAPGP